jgi:hypothetical protein
MGWRPDLARGGAGALAGEQPVVQGGDPGERAIQR